MNFSIFPLSLVRLRAKNHHPMESATAVDRPYGATPASLPQS